MVEVLIFRELAKSVIVYLLMIAIKHVVQNSIHIITIHQQRIAQVSVCLSIIYVSSAVVLAVAVVITIAKLQIDSVAYRFAISCLR